MAYSILLSTCWRHGMCFAVSQHNIVLLLKGPHLRMISPFSVSLAATQLWLMIVLVSSFAWSPSLPYLRDRIHTHVSPLIDCYMLLCLCHCVICFNLIKHMSKSSQRCSRRSYTTVVFSGSSSENSVHYTCVFVLRWCWAWHDISS